jgi:hypothetical protein
MITCPGSVIVDVIPLRGWYVIKTLKRISDLYVAAVPAMLNSAKLDSKMYGAFIPYFGWDAEPKDHAEHASSVYILTSEMLNQVKKQHKDSGQVGYHSYCWANFCSTEPMPIGDAKLTEQLLEWYQYQNENEETIGEESLLGQIGKSMSTACRALNKLDWSPDKFKSDFVVFSDCMAAEEYEHGLSSCVPAKWLNSKKKDGLFTEWLT